MLALHGTPDKHTRFAETHSLDGNAAAFTLDPKVMRSRSRGVSSIGNLVVRQKWWPTALSYRSVWQL